MNEVTLSDVRNVLLQYQGRFRWLDVFVLDVLELRDNTAPLLVTNAANNEFQVVVHGTPLDLKVFPEAGVARFALAANAPNAGDAAIVGAGIGAGVGALAGAAARPRGPEGLVLGLLVGGLVGALVGGAVQGPDPTKIMTLQYQPSTGRWMIYKGPYRDWAKEALRAPA